MTHLAVANNKNNPLTKLQIKNFARAKEKILKKGFTPKWFHIGGSDSLAWVDPKLANVIRVGRILYGITCHPDPSGGIPLYKRQKIDSLLPILELHSTITQIKHLKKGEAVGYDATFSAQKDMTIAVLPLGYNDGVNRNLSNKGIVKISGIECPIVGLVSMNMITVDISKVKSPKVGDNAIIFSSNLQDKNSIENSAKLINTNPSNLLVSLHSSTRRELLQM